MIGKPNKSKVFVNWKTNGSEQDIKNQLSMPEAMHNNVMFTLI
jgi:hypothetical protein